MPRKDFLPPPPGTISPSTLRSFLFHIWEEGLCDRFIFRTASGEAFERPDQFEIGGLDGSGLGQSTCVFVIGNLRCIRPLDAIVSVEALPAVARPTGDAEGE